MFLPLKLGYSFISDCYKGLTLKRLFSIKKSFLTENLIIFITPSDQSQSTALWYISFSLFILLCFYSNHVLVLIVSGPAFNIFLRLCDFQLGPFVVNKYTAPGVNCTHNFYTKLYIFIIFHVYLEKEVNSIKPIHFF